MARNPDYKVRGLSAQKDVSPPHGELAYCPGKRGILYFCTGLFFCGSHLAGLDVSSETFNICFKDYIKFANLATYTIYLIKVL